MFLADRLLKAGASVDVKGPNGQTALWMASRGGHLGCVARLLKAGATPDRPDASGASALYAAAGGGRDAVVEALLAAGADADAADHDGWTPLYLSCEMGHNAGTAACAAKLLAAGAAADLPAADGRGLPVERARVGRAGARLLAPGVDVVVELLLTLDHDGHRRIARISRRRREETRSRSRFTPRKKTALHRAPVTQRWQSLNS